MIINGIEVLLDEEDEKRLSIYKYNFVRHHRNIYVYRSGRVDGKRKEIMLHRDVLNFINNNGMVIDHINGNALDNRKCNLRICTNAENVRNQRINKKNTSGYKGVTWLKNANKWRAKIKLNNIDIHLGLFADIEDAAKAYAEASKKYHGEFGRIR